MKTIISHMIAVILRIAIWFRYRIKVKGLDKLDSKTLSKTGGVLFLPNHPAVFIDPVAITLAAWPKFPIRPMVVEYMYNLPGVYFVMRLVGALPVPNFSTSTNSLKKRKNEAVTEAVIKGLRDQENFLIYPAGKLKDTAVEAIGGASAVHYIIQQSPDANIVLVRIKGLWGSMFSRAFLGVTPPFIPTLLKGIKIAFRNLLFFTPRRKIVIEFEPAPEDFPRNASRLELNRWLENWYNQPDGLTQQKGDLPGDSFILVSHSMWGELYPEMRQAHSDDEADIALEGIPQEIKTKVIQKLTEMTEIAPEKISPHMKLASDLGLDSLDGAELTAFLDDEFEIKGATAAELTSVARLMAIAAKQVPVKDNNQENHVDLSVWNQPIAPRNVAIYPGKTIPEVFLNACEDRKKQAAAADLVAGVLTYAQMKMRVVLMAEYIRKLPGQYVGILLPASVASSVLILATQLAGKVPLMINWTVGARHLDSVVKLSDVDVVLSSWSFLDRLENVDLEPIHKKIVLLEDVRRRFSIIDKLRAALRAKRSAKSILKLFKADKLKPQDRAVLLFTSGTESLPKGVPLTHENILTNIRASIGTVQVRAEDVLYGILPPFHAFGFTVSVLLGFLGGIRIAFSPDPTDGRRLASGLERWGVSVVCAAPTFIKGMMKAAQPSDLKTLRLCATGAEKAPPELFELFDNLNLQGVLREGYGITECSPVLTMNREGKIAKGVGEAIEGVELAIVHPETHMPLPVGSQGLILARGPNIFSGYLNPGIASPFLDYQGQKWYKTGDLGFLDEEGRLTISGRMKRFIKVGGEMVSLAAIEDSLLKVARAKGWPLADEGATLAVCAKEKAGEKPKIYLFARFSASTEEINKTLKEQGFSNLVRVSSVHTMEEIPLMGTGKVNYRALESQLEEAL